MRKLTEIVTVAGVASVAVAGLGYFNTKYEKRVDETIKMYRELEIDDSKASWYKRFLNDPKTRLFISSKDLIDQEYKEFVFATYFDDDGYMDLFMTMHGNYETIAWCAITGLCDSQTACKLSWIDLQQFYWRNERIYSEIDLIENRRKDLNADTAAALRHFMSLCDRSNVILRGDGTYCQLAIFVRGYLNLNPGDECSFSSTAGAAADTLSVEHASHASDE